MPTKTITERWIVAVKELHLGHCKDTFRAGAVIELDEENGRLFIDGRRFDDTRDLDVLKSQSERVPESPFVVPYSREARQEIIARFAPVLAERKKLRDDQRMQVIDSDEDLNDTIDISDTKISKKNAQAKAAAKAKVAHEGMEIIRGDETVEERLASLKGKTDISSIAERARLKATGSARMPVVKDDSLGAGFVGKSGVSLNAGQHLPSREEADAKKATALAQAQSRKKAAEAKRQYEPDDGETGSSQDGLRRENEELKARLAKLEGATGKKTGRKPGRPKKVK